MKNTIFISAALICLLFADVFSQDEDEHCDFSSGTHPDVYYLELTKIKPRLKSHPNCDGETDKEMLTLCLRFEASNRLFRIDIDKLTPLKSHPNCNKCKDRIDRITCLKTAAYAKIIKDASYPFTKAELQEFERERREHQEYAKDEERNNAYTQEEIQILQEAAVINTNRSYRENHKAAEIGGISDQLGSLMGGSSRGLGTEAKSSLKAPSAKDIEISEGSRSKPEIMAVVNQRFPGLNNIYNKYLKLKPDFSGKVTLKFNIEPSGNIVSISIVSSTTDYNEFDNAIKDHIAKSWKWKVINSGNSTVTIQFSFAK
ncbi:MAG: AgmX/PglI C-terminal domain-containing protein [Fibromonadaceae bacterium]|jgi:TonB family protein|nr:AgmX/PglI C-terminal domain-containing protein [Fibromonadaceae bacterium]